MIVAALAFAAALASRAAAPTAAVPPQPKRCRTSIRSPAGCQLVAEQEVVDRHGRPSAKLGDLPRGALILAVERTIGGCQVITVDRGTVAPDTPNPPPQTYRAEPLAKPRP